VTARATNLAEVAAVADRRDRDRLRVEHRHRRHLCGGAVERRVERGARGRAPLRASLRQHVRDAPAHDVDAAAHVRGLARVRARSRAGRAQRAAVARRGRAARDERPGECGVV